MLYIWASSKPRSLMAPGAAGRHAKTAAFAKGGVYFRLAGLFVESGGRVRAYVHTCAACAAIRSRGVCDRSGEIDGLLCQNGCRPGCGCLRLGDALVDRFRVVRKTAQKDAVRCELDRAQLCMGFYEEAVLVYRHLEELSPGRPCSLGRIAVESVSRSGVRIIGLRST